MQFLALCKQVLEWQKNWKTEAFPSNGILLRQGPASIAFIPKLDETRVIKVIKSGCKPYGLSTKEEFEMMQKIEMLHGEFFVTPRAISHESNPDYIAMTRLGKSFGWTVADPNEVKRIGTALGEFSGLLFSKHGALHTDICPGNYTNEPNGKIGVIDIASIEKGDVPEKMFLTPILGPYNICPALAEKFEQVTGRPVDFDLFTRLSEERLAGLLASKNPEDAAMVLERHNVNLEEWRNLRVGEASCRRPEKKKVIRNPRRDI